MTENTVIKEDPLYIKLEDVLMKKIEAGDYLPGEKLPGERALAEIYGINRMTAKNAINGLVQKKYLYRVQGKGTFVQKKDFHKLNLGFLNESGNCGITAMVKSQGVRIANKILTKGTLPPNDYFCGRLKLAKNDPVYSLHRIRYGNEEPIAVEYTYLPCALFPDIESFDFKHVSLYDYMEAHKHMPVAFEQKFRIIPVPQKEAKYLDLDQGQVVYYFEFLGFDENGILVEYTESFTRTDKAEFFFDTNG
ncbi:MAG: GntR family transcriptional regulator [Eubacteriales bacterium]|nr:GntR family transcriptional regulator [Eubacteriales bacterium]MDD3350629.1 GntR family transcriptional regulator [Eubacteriales bacterium]